jgi:hypothetical protein
LKEHTLRLTWPFGQTLGLALIVLFLLVGLAELFARSEGFQAPLTAPAMGTHHYQLGPKMARLQAAIRKDGPIDCLILGSSMVDLGFDPQAFEEEYKNYTGQDIHCFNFGIDALPAVGSAALADILVKDFKPDILIYGTDARDYAVAPDAEDALAILDSNWIQYRLGHFTIEGWLLENFDLYRYRDILSRLIRFNYKGALRSSTKLNHEITPDGFTPYSTVGRYVHDPPDPQDDSFQITYYYSLLANYEMREENLTGLEQILSQNRQSAQVIIVEMPVPDGYFYFFGNGKDDYKRFIGQITDLANNNDVPFLQTTMRNMIPDDGWVDYSHLNTKGAQIFSQWLGQQVGEAVNRGTISIEEPSSDRKF